MKNTKEKIQEKALDLFNESGVEKITTRHIAAQLGISQGNLHYHYANKDLLIEALFERFLAEVKSAEEYTEGNPFDKEQVIGSMKNNYRIMLRFRFFFKDNEVVWRRLPIIEVAIKKLFALKQEQIKTLILQYKAEGIFRESITDDQVDYLAEQFIFSISSWLTASAYFDKKTNSSEYYARYTFRHWLPYLKVDVMKEWEEFLSKP